MCDMGGFQECDFYPLYILDLMVVCWSHVPKDRPSASQVVAIAASPEFILLKDVVSIAKVTNIVSAIGLHYGGKLEIFVLVFFC